MGKEDDEIERLKATVSCAVVLERMPPVWQLDARQSTRRCLKYRRGPGEILIVNHGGRGWWDPLSEAKGDIFTLARHLDPALDFAGARRLLRDFAGVAPSFPATWCPSRNRTPAVAVSQRWERRRRLACGSQVWRYLADERRVPEAILLAARTADAVREGPRGSAWFAHRDSTGAVTGFEMRGPAWRGFASGGTKTLFGLAGGPPPLPRIALTEGAIDALSLAALEGLRLDTLYVATTGGIGPFTEAALMAAIAGVASLPNCVLAVATDADGAGQRYAARLRTLAEDAGVACVRLVPQSGFNDWNDVLRARGAGNDESRAAPEEDGLKTEIRT